MNIKPLITIGCRPDGTQLRRLPQPRTIATLGPGRRVVGIHRPGGADDPVLWIVADQSDSASTLKWCRAHGSDSDSTTTPTLHDTGMTGVDPSGPCASMGPIFMAGAADGIHYLRWNGTDYDHLGTGVPLPAVEWRLVREPMPLGQMDVEIPLDTASLASAASRSIAQGYPRLHLTDAHPLARGALTDAVGGGLLSAAAKHVTALGRFWQPFMVRCAIRLADGTLASHTPAVMMWPSATAPLLEATDLKVDTDTLTLSATMRLNGPWGVQRCRLEMRMLQCDTEQLRRWEPMIEGLEIAVTDPIWTYDQSAPVSGLDTLAAIAGGAATGSGSGQRPGAGGSGTTEGTGGDTYIFTGHFCPSDGMPCAEQRATPDELTGTGWMLKRRTDTEFDADLTSRAVFHTVATLTSEELMRLVESRQWSAVIPGPGTLTTLANQPLMADGIYTGDRWDCRAITVYNGRLTAAPQRRMMCRPAPFRAHVCHSGAPAGSSDWIHVSVGVGASWEGGRVGALRSWRSPGTDLSASPDMQPDAVARLTTHFPRWIYVPDRDVRQMVIYTDDGGPLRITLRLTPHPVLEGAYWYGGRGMQSPVADTTPEASLPPDVGEPGAACPGLLLTSEAASPAVWAPGGSLRVAGRNIYALRAALRPMSEGQFGQWPMYVFSDLGVTALQPDESGAGTWRSQRLITPRGLIAPDALTAMDGGVAYLSTGGVMLLGGSTVECIQLTLDDQNLRCPAPDTIPGLRLMATMAGHEAALQYAGEPPGGTLRLCYDPADHLLLLFGAGTDHYARAWHAPTRTWSLLRLGTPLSGAVSEAEGASRPLLTSGGSGRVSVLGDSPAESASLIMSEVSGGKPRRPGEAFISGTPPQGIEGITIYGSMDSQLWRPVASAKSARLPRSVCGTPHRYLMMAAVTSRELAQVYVTGM